MLFNQPAMVLVRQLVVVAFVIFVTFVVFYMSFAVAKNIATALVSSGLDYCNSQRVQYYSARVVTQFPRFSRSLSLLISLH